MIRISWGLALLVTIVIVFVARNPRLLVPMVVVFAVWFLVQSSRSRKER